jgi:hypothetical protein
MRYLNLGANHALGYFVERPEDPRQKKKSFPFQSIGSLKNAAVK